MASGTYGHSHEYRRNPAMNHGMMNVGSLSGLDSGENSGREKRSHEIASSLDVANAGFPELRKHGSCYSGGEVMNAKGTTVVLPRPVSMEKQQSSTAGGSSDSLNIGLELGKRTYFGVSGGSAAVSAAVSTTAAAAAAPAKRGRATAPPTPRCQVEGCKIDLSSAKDYHRRHKVCALHSKTARVTVAGQEQRFCQQCSRYCENARC